MNEAWNLVFVFVGGIVLGTLFFGALWFTVKKSMTAKVPALWIVGGFFIRISMALVGFYYVSRDSWEGLLICLLGFIIARMGVMKLTKQN